MEYSVLVYCNTFFQEAKPWRCRSFLHFGQHSPTMQLRHQDTLIFMFNAFSPFNPSIYVFLIAIWTTSDQAGDFPIYKLSFSKKFRPKILIFVLFLFFFLVFFFKFREA